MRRAFLLAVAFACLCRVPGQAAVLTTAVDSIGITVSDLDRSVDFYTKVLHFEKESESEHWGDAWEHRSGVFGSRVRIARLRLGEEHIELTQYLTPQGAAIPADSRSNDRWFQHLAIIVTDMDRAYRWLRSQRVRHASTSPQRLPDWNQNAAGIEAFYFLDPDGHVLEVLHFPEGKGAAYTLFLGIDHTAIVVADTEVSLRFYRDVLGLRVAGESENYGPEQEHLNNVFGARLRITTMRAASGPGIEFLEYLAPRDGRPYPASAKANDLLHWQTRMVGPSVEAAARTLRAAKAAVVSLATEALPGAPTLGSSAVVARDPDGHAIEIIQP
jgi:catechol 2,3-dioxygenase-like lactoylglutathione lyase family enzyme